MPWRVFYSYAHEDATLREKLGTFLAPLRQQNKIVEWHDRMIEAGAEWQAEINDALDSADLILLLVSPEFLASDYCFGIEVNRALERLKKHQVRVVPVLLRDCMWEDSRFSQLQFIPRDGRTLVSYASLDEALKEVATEIRRIVSSPTPGDSSAAVHLEQKQVAEPSSPHLGIVRDQITAYARLYERTRQRMEASNERTRLMEEIFQKLHALATASYPLLDELVNSPSPGERLAGIAVLQSFAVERHFPFLARVIETEKPFVAYHAAKALRFAVNATDTPTHPALASAIDEGRAALDRMHVPPGTDRQTMLRSASDELKRLSTLTTRRS